MQDQHGIITQVDMLIPKRNSSFHVIIIYAIIQTFENTILIITISWDNVHMPSDPKLSRAYYNILGEYTTNVLTFAYIILVRTRKLKICLFQTILWLLGL